MKHEDRRAKIASDPIFAAKHRAHDAEYRRKKRAEAKEARLKIIRARNEELQREFEIAQKRNIWEMKAKEKE